MDIVISIFYILEAIKELLYIHLFAFYYNRYNHIYYNNIFGSTEISFKHTSVILFVRPHKMHVNNYIMITKVNITSKFYIFILKFEMNFCR